MTSGRTGEWSGRRVVVFTNLILVSLAVIFRAYRHVPNELYTSHGFIGVLEQENMVYQTWILVILMWAVTDSAVSWMVGASLVSLLFFGPVPALICLVSCIASCGFVRMMDYLYAGVFSP